MRRGKLEKSSSVTQAMNSSARWRPRRIKQAVQASVACSVATCTGCQPVGCTALRSGQHYLFVLAQGPQNAQFVPLDDFEVGSDMPFVNTGAVTA